MWYSGRSRDKDSEQSVDDSLLSSVGVFGAVGVAVSVDGVDWKREEIVLRPNDDAWWAFDTNCVGVSDLHRISQGAGGPGGDSPSMYYMYYSGCDYEEVTLPRGAAGILGMNSVSKVPGLRLRPGVAVSPDGLNWARLEGPSTTGAVLDIGNEKESCQNVFAAFPQVIWFGQDDARMYYSTLNLESGRYEIHMARSKDGIQWRRDLSHCGRILGAGKSGSFDAKGVLACHIVRLPDSGHLAMFYEGVGEDGLRSIGMATCESGDGVSWRRRDTPLLEGNKERNAWDSGGVGKPSVVLFKSSIRLYFEGRRSSNSLPSGIGLATASLKDFAFTRY